MPKELPAANFTEGIEAKETVTVSDRERILHMSEVAEIVGDIHLRAPAHYVPRILNVIASLNEADSETFLSLLDENGFDSFYIEWHSMDGSFPTETLRPLLFHMDRNGIYKGTILKKITELDSVDGLEMIIDYTRKELKEIGDIVDGATAYDEVVEWDGSVRNRLEILVHAFDALPKFSNLDGLRAAESLYTIYGELKSKIQLLKQRTESQRMESLIDQNELNKILQKKDDNELSEEEVKDIRQRIHALQVMPFYSVMGKVFYSRELPIALDEVRRGNLDILKFNRLTFFGDEALLTSAHKVFVARSLEERSFNVPHKVLQDLFLQDDKLCADLFSEYVRLGMDAVIAAEDADEMFRLLESMRTAFDLIKKSDIGSQYVRENIIKLFESYPELIGRKYVDGFDLLHERHLPTIERPVEKERREWRHESLMVRGSALFSVILGRGKEKVRDLDIFLLSHLASETKVLKTKNLNEIEHLLPEAEYERVFSWAKKYGFEGHEVNLVRIPFHQIVLESSFNNEPRLTLWDERIDNADYADDREKEVVNNMPEYLVPGGTMTRALRVMDLGERFEIPYDVEMLEEAEKMARNGTLLISAHGVDQFPIFHEGVGNIVVDPPFIKVFSDKKLRKLLLNKFPRLAQISEDIESHGGIREYISEKFGEVYLKRGHVRLYDFDLTNSPLTVEEQQIFLAEWYRKEQVEGFKLVAYEKISDEAVLPETPNLDKYINKGRLEDAEKDRKQKDLVLEGLVGEYELTVSGGGAGKEKIERFLQAMNLDWPSSVDMEKDKVTKTLIKLGVHQKNPILSEFDRTNSHKISLVISNNSKDILGASTEKPWRSCVRLGGSEPDEREPGVHAASLYEDVRMGNVIAYLVNDGAYVARKLIRGGRSLDSFKPSAFDEHLYGDARYAAAMKMALKKIFKENNVLRGVPMITNQGRRSIYADSSHQVVDAKGFISLVYNNV